MKHQWENSRLAHLIPARALSFLSSRFRTPGAPVQVYFIQTKSSQHKLHAMTSQLYFMNDDVSLPQ